MGERQGRRAGQRLSETALHQGCMKTWQPALATGAGGTGLASDPLSSELSTGAALARAAQRARGRSEARGGRHWATTGHRPLADGNGSRHRATTQADLKGTRPKQKEKAAFEKKTKHFGTARRPFHPWVS